MHDEPVLHCRVPGCGGGVRRVMHSPMTLFNKSEGPDKDKAGKMGPGHDLGPLDDYGGSHDDRHDDFDF